MVSFTVLHRSHTVPLRALRNSEVSQSSELFHESFAPPPLHSSVCSTWVKNEITKLSICFCLGMLCILFTLCNGLWLTHIAPSVIEIWFYFIIQYTFMFFLNESTHRFILKFIHTEKPRFSSQTCLPVVFSDVRQYAIYADMGSGAKFPPTERTLVWPAAAPVNTETCFTKAVSAGCCHWVAEDLLTQRAQEVLLRQETDGRFHSWETTMSQNCQNKHESTILCCKSHLIMILFKAL